MIKKINLQKAVLLPEKTIALIALVIAKEAIMQNKKDFSNLQTHSFHIVIILQIHNSEIRSEVRFV